MSIRSKMKFGGGLPVGGRSSGGRPKKKVKTKLKKSKARIAAEDKLERAKYNRKQEKETRAQSHYTKTNLARTPGKQAKALKQLARKRASAGRVETRPGLKESYESEAKFLRRMSEGKTKTKVSRSRKVTPIGKKRDSSPGMQGLGKKVIKARKNLARTPRQGGKVRISSGNRNMFLQDPKLSDH